METKRLRNGLVSKMKSRAVFDGWRPRSYRRLFASLLALQLCVSPSFLKYGFAEDEKVPDLDDVINSQEASSSEGGGDAPADDSSVADLEKAILNENPSAEPTPQDAPVADAANEPIPEPVLDAPARDTAAAPNDAPLIGEPDLTEATPSAPLDEAQATPPAEVPASEPPLPAEPVQQTNPEPAAPPPPMESAANDVPATTGKNQIKNIEFRMEGAVSRISVTSTGPLTYREVRNSQVKQVVYFFDNAEAAQRLQRAYDTTEFPTPVALFTVLQMPVGEPPVTKLIVQLRDDKVPTVTPNDRGLFIDFPAPDQKTGQRISGDEDPGTAVEENIYSGSQVFTGKTIKRLEIKNSDIQDVLRLIAKTSGYNIVVGDEVQGKVGTLSLENIPWDQAFALVLQSKKLGYVRQGNVIRVGSLSELKAEKELAISNEASKVRVEPLRTVLIPVSYAKASELSIQARNFMTERGSVDVDTRTNTVILKDVDKVVTRVQKIFSALDTPPPRVAISAKIIEMQSSFSRNIGFSKFQFNEVISGVNVLHGTNFDVKGTSITSLSAPAFANLLTEFQLGELEQKARTLANPSVSVVANQTATVNQAISFFLLVPEVVGANVIPAVRQITANLTLSVTPIVAGDGSIFMTVNIRNEVPVGTPPNIQIDSRTVNTQILIENGDTAVVGGVFQNTVNHGKEGIPFLMKVPILGFFFSRTGVTDTRAETFIFLTAKIMNAEESFKRNF